MPRELMDLEELIENFEFLDDWEDRYRYLIELGREYAHIPEEAKVEANKVPGCTSQVWMISDAMGDTPRLHFEADSDAHIVRGLIAILLNAYSDKTPDEIAAIDIRAVFQRLGLDEHLTPNRRNGFFAMVERIQHDARQRAAAPA